MPGQLLGTFRGGAPGAGSVRCALALNAKVGDAHALRGAALQQAQHMVVESAETSPQSARVPALPLPWHVPLAQDALRHLQPLQDSKRARFHVQGLSEGHESMRSRWSACAPICMRCML